MDKVRRGKFRKMVKHKGDGMKHIYKFCKDAIHISGTTHEIESLSDYKINIDMNKDMIKRNRVSTDYSTIFDFPLLLNGADTLPEQVRYMRSIELFYPNKFSWRFNGKEIEAIARIPMKKEYLGIFGRYKGMYQFITYLRKQLINVLKYRDLVDDARAKVWYNEIIATGSLNIDTNLYAIDILPTYAESKILDNANNRIITDVEIKDLDMKFWVKEINPDFYKTIDYSKKAKKYPITPEIWSKYPKCIGRLCKMEKKGNYNRFLLATFFLAVHNERDAKHQFDIVLSDTEREHINTGNCKDQWRAILARNYNPPSWKTMIESGHVKDDDDTSAPAPHFLDWGEDKEDQNPDLV